MRHVRPEENPLSTVTVQRVAPSTMLCERLTHPTMRSIKPAADEAVAVTSTNRGDNLFEGCAAHRRS